MKHINAFVGHSFADEDKEVVDRLLGMLNDIKTLMPDFDWDHAQKAEPKALSAKILEKVEGKNLFIGICTGKEDVITTSSRHSPWWIPKDKVLLSVNADLQRKPSDWVIQEIGLAIGRKMDVIVLLEDGVRQPGGLQGELEYIPFSRSQPELCLSKLTSMLRALSPKTGSGDAAQKAPATEPPTTESATPSPSPASADDVFTPDSSWTPNMYINVHGAAIRWKDGEIENKVNAAFRESPYFKDEQTLAAFEAEAVIARAEVTQTEWMGPLKKLLEKYPRCYGPYEAMGERFIALDEHGVAADYLEKAASFAASPKQRVDLLAKAALHRAKNGEVDLAKRRISECLEAAMTSPQYESIAYELTAPVWREIGDDSMFFAVAERALELSPDNTSLRFDIAHRYSALNREAEALYHYRQHLRVERGDGALNNFGVSAAALKLQVTAVDAYKEADSRGNTLATSNLAYAFLEAGFLGEAIEACKSGLTREKPHSRLLDAYGAAQRAKEAEEEKEQKLADETKKARDHLRLVGAAVFSKGPGSVPPKWKSKECELSATYSGSTLTLKGQYARKLSTLASLIAPSREEESETVEVAYVGAVHGRAFVGKVLRSSPGGNASVLRIASEEVGIDCVGYFDPQIRSLTILEKGESRTLSAAV